MHVIKMNAGEGTSIRDVTGTPCIHSCARVQYSRVRTAYLMIARLFPPLHLSEPTQPSRCNIPYSIPHGSISRAHVAANAARSQPCITSMDGPRHPREQCAPMDLRMCAPSTVYIRPVTHATKAVSVRVAYNVHAIDVDSVAYICSFLFARLPRVVSDIVHASTC